MSERLTWKRAAEKKEAGEETTFESLPINLKRRRIDKNPTDTLEIAPIVASTPIDIDRFGVNNHLQDVEMTPADTAQNQNPGESMLSREYIQNFPIEYNYLTINIIKEIS